MKIRFVIIAITFVAFSGFCLCAAAQQLNERLITRQPAQRDEPITVTDIKVNGHSVSVDKKFNGGDDWMLTLGFTLRNESDKPILMAELNLTFRDLSNPKKQPARFDLLRYGNAALTYRSLHSDERLIRLNPGETTEIAFTAQRFVDLKRFLSDLGFPTSVEKVEFSLGHVIFDDDTMWYAGEIAQRDPKNPSTWVNSRFLTSKPQ